MSVARPPERERLPAPKDRRLFEPAPKKRMLVIVNPYATTVSDRLRNLVVYALKGRYEVEAVDTQSPLHAMEITRESRDQGFDLVVAFGGDGTVNEVANGLAGSNVAMSALPGGKTNVFCRTLGIPNDVVDATEHLLGLADDFNARRVDLGRVNGRFFVFGSGIGLDAHVVRRCDEHPRLKATVGHPYYVWCALTSFYTHYLRHPPRLRMEVPGHPPAKAVTVIVQNSHPFTYFGKREIAINDGVSLDSGALSMVGLARASQRDVPALIWRLNTGARVTAHRHVEHREGLTEARVVSLPQAEGGEPLPVPLQVDGDYVGDITVADYDIAPGALAVVA